MVIKVPSKTIDDFNNLKSPTLYSIQGEHVVVRFSNYIDKECEVKILDKRPLSYIIDLMKELTCSPIKFTYSYERRPITFEQPNEYMSLFGKYLEWIDEFWEFKIHWTTRVFWFFLWWERPSFNIVLIKNAHLPDSKKVKRW